LWQVGVRDRSQMVGGIGVCGQLLCCHAFLKDFESISVNMAKNKGFYLILIRLRALAVAYYVVCAMNTTGTARRLPTLPEQGSRVKVKKDGQVKEVRIVTRNAVLRTAYVSDDEGNMFWVDFEEIDTTCGMTQKGE